MGSDSITSPALISPAASSIGYATEQTYEWMRYGAPAAFLAVSFTLGKFEMVWRGAPHRVFRARGRVRCLRYEPPDYVPVEGTSSELGSSGLPWPGCGW